MFRWTQTSLSTNPSALLKITEVYVSKPHNLAFCHNIIFSLTDSDLVLALNRILALKIILMFDCQTNNVSASQMIFLI